MRLFTLFLILTFYFSVNGQEQVSFSDKVDFILELGIGVHDGRQFNSQHIHLDYELNDRLKIGSGIGYDIYKIRSNLTNISTQESFGFGNQATRTVLRPESGHYLNIPINFSFHPSKTTKLEVGISNNIFIGAKGSIQPENQFFNDDFFFLQQPTPLRWIEPYGFKKYFTALHFSGSFFSIKGWGIKLAYFKAITSLANSASEIPSGMNLFRGTDKIGGFSIHAVYRFL